MEKCLNTNKTYQTNQAVKKIIIQANQENSLLDLFLYLTYHKFIAFLYFSSEPLKDNDKF